MQRKFYTSLVEKIRSNPLLCKVVTILCKGLPWLVVAAYGVTLVVLLCTWNLKWIFFVIVPAVTVVLVTLLRNALNRSRPFERYGYTPLVSHGKGKSFPSRHTACAVVIGMACYYVHPAYGIPMLVLSAAVGITRVMAGVHHIIDVLAGAAISVACGLLGFVVFAPLFGL